MTESPILDASGRPMRRADLEEEMAGPSITGVRSILSGHPASNITPVRMASILRSAEAGNAISYYELAEQMEENDLHYAAVLGTRKRAVLKVKPRVEAADDSEAAKRHAEVITNWLKRPVLRQEAFDIMDAVAKGISHTEIMWPKHSPGPYYLPSELKWRDPCWFEFDQVDGETSRLRSDAGQLTDLRPMKFIRHIHPYKSGASVVRNGLARPVAWYWMFKTYSIKDWVTFLERYGHPLKKGRYDQGASEGDIRKLARAVSSLGTQAGAVFPRTMDIEIESQTGGTSPQPLWGHATQFFNDEISKIVLGQTSSADAKAGGLGSGQANLHDEVRGDLAEFDRTLFANTLNRDLVKPIIDWNFGPQPAYPQIVIEEPEAVDVKLTIETAEKFVKLGGKVSRKGLADKLGLPEPEDEDDELKIDGAENAPQEALEGLDGPPIPKNAKPALLEALRGLKLGGKSAGEKQSAASALPAPENDDAITRLSDELISDWDDMFEEMVSPLEAALASAGSLEEARTLLAEQLGAMDVSALATLLGNAGFATHLAGEVDAAKDELR